MGIFCTELHCPWHWEIYGAYSMLVDPWVESVLKLDELQLRWRREFDALSGYPIHVPDNVVFESGRRRECRVQFFCRQSPTNFALIPFSTFHRMQRYETKLKGTFHFSRRSLQLLAALTNFATG